MKNINYKYFYIFSFGGKNSFANYCHTGATPIQLGLSKNLYQSFIEHNHHTEKLQ